jgi:hypothetical protein
LASARFVIRVLMLAGGAGLVLVDAYFEDRALLWTGKNRP